MTETNKDRAKQSEAITSLRLGNRKIIFFADTYLKRKKKNQNAKVMQATQAHAPP